MPSDHQLGWRWRAVTAATNVDPGETYAENSYHAEYRINEPNICVLKILFCRLTVIA